ncbi:MAG: MFS transporter [Deltaproteobacteria bacterium]|nr:MFS transporter [Deltaproteobacteria bacterium]MBW2128359.1 MFS transporter [Deltaproteobacteria bacterium]MBW2302513.1 MFS transporter [Deltaproteobacteria bacterium]
MKTTKKNPCPSASPKASPPGDPALRRPALIVATISSFMTPFMGSSINLALPAISKQFQIGAVLLSWVATSYLLASAVSLVPFGRIADIHGRKLVFSWGILLFTLSSLLCALSFSASALILFRIFQGIGSAMVFSTGIAILTSVFPPWERGKVLGINVAAVYVGLALGPSLGGFLTQHLTWRSVFLANIPFGLIVIFLVWWRLPGEWAEARGESFDVPGSLLYTLAVFGAMYGLSLLPEVKGALILLGGLVCLTIFIIWEERTENPVFELRLFRTNRVFAFSSLAALINYSATFAVTFLLSLFLQHIKGLSPQKAGMVLMAQPVVMAIFSPLAGRISDRVEPRVVASLGMALTTAGLLFFTFADSSISLAGLTGGLVLLGLGFAVFSSPNTNAIMGSVEKRFYGIASGAVGTMRLLGMLISMAVVTFLFSLLIGHARITPQNHSLFLKSMKASFLVFSLLCFGGIFASMTRGRLRDGESLAPPPAGPKKDPPS